MEISARSCVVRELAQLGQPGHGAVVVHHLGQHPGLRQPGQPGQVDRGLGVPGPAQHAAFGVAEREHVAGADQVLRGGGRVDQAGDGGGPVGGRDAGGDAVAGVDADSVKAVRMRSVFWEVISGSCSRSSSARAAERRSRRWCSGS